MSVPDLVLHIGMQQSGATMIQRALSRLRPQLRAHGVAYIGHRRISELEHVAGWDRTADCDPSQAADFERELAAAVAHEQGRVTEARGGTAGTVLVASDHMVGADNLDHTDGSPFRPHAVPAVAQVLRALGAERTRLVLYTHRQDRLMEFCYLREIQKGAHHDLAEQFPQRFDPVFDYHDLIERLRSLPQVTDIRVRPFELVAAGQRAFVDDFLDAVDLKGALDLDVIGNDLAPHRVYSRRGLRIALGMNPHLETGRDRKLVREFLLANFAAEDERQSRFLPRRERQKILAAYREQNRRLFRTHMPDLPEDSYEDNEATARLGGVAGPSTGDRSAASGRRSGLVGMLPTLVGDRGRGGSTGTSGGAAEPLAGVVAHLADRNTVLYRLKVRMLGRRCDAFVVSFPKCGRTWLRMMLGTALGEHYGVTVRNVRRFTDADVHHPGMPRVLATHDDSPQTKPANRVMRDKRAYRGSSVVLLVRDPRDVIVSLYFHVTRRRGRPYEGDLADFVRDRTGSLASLLAFYDAWTPRLGDDNVLLVRYEDMHTDPGRELRRVLAFLGVERVADVTVDRAVTGASFERLQRMEREGSAPTRALRTVTIDDPESYKVRRGKVGGFVDYLDPEDIAAIDDAIARSPGARALGYATDTNERGTTTA